MILTEIDGAENQMVFKAEGHGVEGDHRAEGKGIIEAVAAQLGLTKNAIGGWELGRTRPDVDMIPLICNVLHIPVTELLGLPNEVALPHEDRSVLDMYHRLDKYNKRTVSQLMERLLFQQDSTERMRLRSTYTSLCLYEEAAAAGIGAPMQDYAESKTVYAPISKIPNGADTIIHVNGTSMEPTFPNGCYVYVNSNQNVSYGQIDVRCCGRVIGIVEEGEIASGSLLEKIEAAFEEEV